MDTLTPAERSRRMSLVRCKDTKPEMLVRRLAHRMGFRYRLHVRSLPGVPDLVFKSRKKVVFVHGCFWHRHLCSLGNRTPKSRVEFWREKLNGNRRRDAANRRLLRTEGWKILTLWECELSDPQPVATKLRNFLEPDGSTAPPVRS